MDNKITVKVNASTEDFDKAIQKIEILTEKIQELKNEANALNSCINDLVLKVDVKG